MGHIVVPLLCRTLGGEHDADRLAVMRKERKLEVFAHKPIAAAISIVLPVFSAILCNAVGSQITASCSTRRRRLTLRAELGSRRGQGFPQGGAPAPRKVDLVGVQELALVALGVQGVVDERLARSALLAGLLALLPGLGLDGLGRRALEHLEARHLAVGHFLLICSWSETFNVKITIRYI